MRKISIIIPIYNVEEYLIEALESICNQTLVDFEAILIDDGSTDSSLDIAREYVNRDKRLKLICQSNKGPGKARNKGLSIASGEYIVFMDSDDVLPLDSLEIRYNLIKRTEADIVIGGTLIYNGEKKWPINTHFSSEGFKDIDKNEDLVLSLGPGNKIFRKEILKDIVFPTDIKYGEDQVFIINTYIKSKKIFKTNDIIYYYRKRNNEKAISLTDLENKNPNYVLSKMKEVWEKIIYLVDYNVEDYEKRLNIKKIYFKRMININLWPPIMSLMVKNDESEIYKGLKIFKNILEITDKEILISSKELEIILTYGFMRKRNFLSSESLIVYKEIFILVYNHKFKSICNRLTNCNDIKPIYSIAILNGGIYYFRKIISIPSKIYKYFKFRI